MSSSTSQALVFYQMRSFKNEPDRKEPRARTRTPRRGGVETDSKPKKEKNKEEKKKRNKEMDSTELTAERSRLIQTKKKKIMRTETTDQCPKIIRSLCVCVQKTNLTACSFQVFSLHSFSSSLLRKNGMQRHAEDVESVEW